MKKVSNTPSAASELESYDGWRLARELARAFESRAAEEVTVALLERDRMITASADSSGVRQDCETARIRRPLGCMVKLLTGTLALRARAEGRLDFDRILSEEDAPLLHPWLHRSSVRQLLNHTHGLDISGSGVIKLAPSGFIDVPALGERLSRSRRLFEPGTLYSYGNVGCWLTAAILETIYRSTYSDLLASAILQPAGIAFEPRDPIQGVWCPATGGDLQLSAEELLCVLEWCIGQPALFRSQLDAGWPPPPGVCLELGSCAGWKSYGSGWYGHHMAMERHSLAVRVQFERRIAIVISAVGSSVDAAGMVLARLFGRFLPEFARLRLPRALGTPVRRTEMAQSIGTYASEAVVARVGPDDRDGLSLELFEGGDSDRESTPQMRAPLMHGSDGVVFAGSLLLQFLSPSGSGCEYIWNGKQVLRRTEVPITEPSHEN